MPLSQLTVKDFKSYAGTTVIPLAQFTAVIGPNGAGKSNILDALRFALGCQAKDLRCTSLAELIHTSESSASVSLTVSTGATGASSTTEFLRTVQTNGTSQYAVAGKRVSQQEYHTALASVGLPPAARTGFVLQHEVRRLSLKRPKELSELFERLSGAAQYREAYDEQKVAHEEAQREYVALHRERKQAAAQKQIDDEALRRATEFDRLQKDVTAAKTELGTLRVAHLVLQHQLLQSQADRAEQEKAAREEADRERREQLASAKKDRAKAAKEVQQCEALMSGTSARGGDESAAEQRRAEARVSAANDAIAAVEGRISTLAQRQAEHVRKRDALDTEIADAEKVHAQIVSAVEKLEKQLSLAATTESSTMPSSAQDLAQRREAQVLETQLQVEDAALRSLESDTMRLDATIEELTSRLADTRTKAAAAAKQVAELSKDASAIAADIVKRRERAAVLEGEVARAKDEVTSLDSRRRQLKEVQRENASRAALAQALSSFGSGRSGYRGRLCDALRFVDAQAEAKYAKALVAALGRHYEAVVVDDVKTARELLQYMRDNRIGSITVIPLESIANQKRHQNRPQDNDDDDDDDDDAGPLTDDDAGCRELMQVVVIPNGLEPAVRMALGSSVIVPDLDAARRLRSQQVSSRSKRTAIVALDGSVIQRNGVVVAGAAGLAERYSRVQAEGESAIVHDRLTAAVKSLQQSEIELRSMGPLQDLEDAKREKDALLRIATQDEAAHSRRIKEMERELATANNRLEEVRKERSRVEAVRQNIQKQLLTLEGTGDGEGADKSKGKGKSKKVSARSKTGEEEEVPLEEMSAVNLRRQLVRKTRDMHDAANAVARLTALRDAVLSSMKQEETQRAALERRKDELQAELKGANRAAEEAAKKLKKALLDAESVAERRRKALEALESAESRVRDAAADDRAAQRERTALEAKYAELAARAVQAHTQIDALIEQLRIQGTRVELKSPDLQRAVALLKGNTVTSKVGRKGSKSTKNKKGKTSKHQSRKRSRRTAETDGNDSDEEMRSAESEEENHSDVEMPDQSAAAIPVIDNDRVDTMLSEKEALLRSRQAELNTLLSSTSIVPALDAAREAVQASEDRVAELRRTLDTAKRTASEREQAFISTRKARVESFMKLYNHVQRVVPVVYAQLTKDGDNPLGGTAYLGLENPEEPYAGGVKYNCTPPGKRVLAEGLGSRSGGEQTMSALAMNIAMQTFVADGPSCMMLVMDEMDAALDGVNVAKSVRFVRAFAHGGIPELGNNGVQVLVVSHREAFFEEADVLVGVSKRNDQSKILTLDLSQFDE